MSYPAYIRLTPEGYWGLYYGDGTEDEPYLLAVGERFESGPAIADAVAALEAWAVENGYDVITPEYMLGEADLSDLIEPEVWDEVFGPADEDGD